MKKKILGFLLTLVMLFSAFTFTACGDNSGIGGNNGGNGGADEKAGKTVLGVVTYNGGWGKEWLESMADEFEEMYKDHEFEPGTGKKGIYIDIKGGKDDVTGDSLPGLMADSTDYDVFFTTLNLRDYATEGDKLMDVTDLVANTMHPKYKKVWSDLGETKTIAEKMDPTIKGYVEYACAGPNGEMPNKVTYYGIPMYSSFYNINYDIDLFYEQGFYMDEDGEFILGTKDGNTEKAIDAAKHAGQDGVKGTEDDGLPITWDDFKKMCEYMKADKHTIPLMWSNINAYRSGFLNNFWANYEGADDWYINVTGQTEEGKTDSEGNVITIDAGNGYLTAGQKGRWAALEFAHTIIDKGWYTEGANHTATQTTFLMRRVDNKRDTSLENIAMILEGGWWENEAKTVLNTLESKYKMKNRRFGLMTYPRMEGHKVDENGNNEMTLVSVTPDSNVVIKKNPKQEDAAKLFFIFTSTEANMRKYTRMTGSTRCYDYDLTEDDYKEMSTFKVSLWKYYKRALDAGNIRYISGPGKFCEYNKNVIGGEYSLMTTSVGYDEKDVFDLFKENKNLTAEEYYTKFKNYYTKDKYKTTFLDKIK